MKKRICSSLNGAPSRFVRITSRTSVAIASARSGPGVAGLGQVAGPERAGEQLGERDRSAVVVDEQAGSADLPEHLPAPTAGGEMAAVLTDDRDGHQPPTAGGVQGA